MHLYQHSVLEILLRKYVCKADWAARRRTYLIIVTHQLFVHMSLQCMDSAENAAVFRYAKSAFPTCTLPRRTLEYILDRIPEGDMCIGLKQTAKII